MFKLVDQDSQLDLVYYEQSIPRYIASISEEHPPHFALNEWRQLLSDNILNIKLVNQNATICIPIEIPMVTVPVEMDSYRCIMQHTYPTWNSYDEFKKLDGYIYINTYGNQRYHIIQREDRIYIKKRNIEYQINTIQFGGLSSDMLNTQEINAKFYKENIYHFEKFSGFYEAESQVQPNRLFEHSASMNLSLALFEYIKRYIIGWFIRNIDKFYNKHSYVSISISANTVHMSIWCKSSQPSDAIGIPLIREIIQV